MVTFEVYCYYVFITVRAKTIIINRHFFRKIIRGSEIVNKGSYYLRLVWLSLIFLFLFLLAKTEIVL